jgi:hypothetical protein
MSFCFSEGKITGCVHEDCIRERLVRLYRAPRTTPRPDVKNMRVMEDPAPEWVVSTLNTVLPRISAQSDAEELMARLLRWCATGNAPERANQICALTVAWIGPRAPMLRTFLREATKTGGGRVAPGKKERKLEAIFAKHAAEAPAKEKQRLDFLRDNPQLAGERCHASRGDGECSWSSCPQLRDDEPAKTDRHCPLDRDDDDA